MEPKSEVGLYQPIAFFHARGNRKDYVPSLP